MIPRTHRGGSPGRPHNPCTAEDGHAFDAWRAAPDRPGRRDRRAARDLRHDLAHGGYLRPLRRGGDRRRGAIPLRPVGQGRRLRLRRGRARRRHGPARNARRGDGAGGRRGGARFAPPVGAGRRPGVLHRRDLGVDRRRPPPPRRGGDLLRQRRLRASGARSRSAPRSCITATATPWSRSTRWKRSATPIRGSNSTSIRAPTTRSSTPSRRATTRRRPRPRTGARSPSSRPGSAMPDGDPGGRRPARLSRRHPGLEPGSRGTPRCPAAPADRPTTAALRPPLWTPAQGRGDGTEGRTLR